MSLRLPPLSANWPFAPKRWPFFYGWVIMLMTGVGIMASMPGQTMGVSVFTDSLIEVLGLERAALSTAYLIGTAMGAIFLPIGGRVFDRIGGRWFFTATAVSFGLAVMGMSQIDRLSNLLGGERLPLVAMAVASLGFFSIRFLGQGMLTLGARSMVAKWWNRKRGLVTAINGVLIAGAFAIAPRFLAWQMEVFGWRGTFIVNGLALAIVVALLGFVFFRDNPEECGLEMDGPYARPDEVSKNPDMLLKRDFTRAEAMRTFAFWSLAGSLAFQGLFFTAYTFHVLDLGRRSAVETETILNFFIWSAFISVTVNPLVGVALDYMRLRWVLMLMNLGGVIFAAGILALPHTWGIGLLVAGMGLSSGIFPAISNISFPRYYGRKEIGAIQGVSTAAMVWGSALGPLMFSLSLDWLGSYRPVIGFSLGVYAILTVFALGTHNPQRKL